MLKRALVLVALWQMVEKLQKEESAGKGETLNDHITCAKQIHNCDLHVLYMLRCSCSVLPGALWLRLEEVQVQRRAWELERGRGAQDTARQHPVQDGLEEGLCTVEGWAGAEVGVQA